MPEAACREPLALPGTYEVRVYSGPAGWNLVGAIELISPANKDSPAERRAFVAKCASYLHAGVSLVLLDVVTSAPLQPPQRLLDFLASRREAAPA